MSDVERVMVGLRLPADLADRMRADAKYRGQALNVWFTRAVAAAVERGEAEKRELSRGQTKRRAKA